MSTGLLAQKRLNKAKAGKQEAISAMEALLEEAGDNDLTAEQEEEYSSFEADVARFDAQMKQAESLLAHAANGQPKRQTTKLTGTLAGESNESEAKIVKVEEGWKKDPKCGFTSHREFFNSVINATRTGDESPQLRFLAAAGSDEQSTVHDAYGGYLLPVGLAPGVSTAPVEADPTLPFITNVPMQTQKVEINARVDKNHSTSVAGGVTMYRRAETQAATSSRMAFEQITLSTNGLFGLAYASEELLSLSPQSFVALLDSGFGEAYTAKVMAEKFSGTGVGQPVGILKAGCKIAIAKESGQAADTINGTNLMKMRAQIWRYDSAIWLANHDTLVQLMQCHIAGTNGDVFLFAPGNGVDSPDTLFGRPIYFTDWAKTLGDEGDIVLANWSEYAWATLGGQNVMRDESIHVRFLENERAFRFKVYNDGQPLWNTALTPPNSSTTRSPIVTLAARA